MCHVRCSIELVFDMFLVRARIKKGIDMLGVRCALSLLLTTFFVCQAAQKDEEVGLNTSERLVTESRRVNIAKQDIEVYKPVVMSGHPYALYRCKTYANNACQQEFRAFRLDGFSDASLPFEKDIRPEDFVGADKIIGIVHKAKEQYVLRAEEPMLVLAQHVKKSAENSSCRYYKAVFFGGSKTKDNNAKATFKFLKKVYETTQREAAKHAFEQAEKGYIKRTYQKGQDNDKSSV